MEYIFALFVFFVVSSFSFADKVACSQRVVDNITNEAVLAFSSETAYYYITKFQNISNDTIDFWVASLWTPSGRKGYKGDMSKVGYTKELWSYDYKNNKKQYLSWFIILVMGMLYIQKHTKAMR